MLYAKSLFKMKQYVFTLELLQNEFCKRPLYTIFLYSFGKYAVKCEQKIFRGCGIGILEECMRSCLSQRRAKIKYYLGIAFKDLNQPLKAFKHFEESSEFFRNKEYVFNDCPKHMKDIMNSYIQEFKDIYELEKVILSTSNDCKRARKNNKKFLVKAEKINNLKAACKALVRADNYNGSL